VLRNVLLLHVAGRKSDKSIYVSVRNSRFRIRVPNRQSAGICNSISNSRTTLVQAAAAAHRRVTASCSTSPLNAIIGLCLTFLLSCAADAAGAPG
jgi:hypothetical protein